MKLKTTLLIVTGALLLGGCTYTAKTTTTTPTVYTPTATPTPTKSQTLNELNEQLNATVDDGGQADLNQLQKDASGL